MPQDVLPVSAIEWITFLLQDLKQTHSAMTTRALFSMLLFGKMCGKDVFEGKSACASHLSHPGMLKIVTVDFGIAAPRATENQKQLYFDCLRQLAEEDKNTEQLLSVLQSNDAFTKQYFDLFTNSQEDVIALHSFDEHPCWKLAVEFKAQQSKFDMKTKHFFFILWAFWAIRNRNSIGSKLKIDLVGFGMYWNEIHLKK